MMPLIFFSMLFFAIAITISMAFDTLLLAISRHAVDYAAITLILPLDIILRFSHYAMLPLCHMF